VRTDARRGLNPLPYLLALACGIARVRFVCLWNGRGSDGPGGTEQMFKEVGQRTGRVTHINTRDL
jgi:hypothetical protein